GGRAIVWGDIALIDGNINAQGKDIAKTGGFVETSGHHLSIDDNVIVKTKEWLLDPEDVSIEAPCASRTNTNIEFPTGTGEINNPKKNSNTLTTLTNTTISNFLKNAGVVNITAKRNLTVNSSIDLKNGNLTLYTETGGINIKADITSTEGDDGAVLNIHSGNWLDIRSNISLKQTDSLNITAKKDIAFEHGSNQKITAQGVITSGYNKGFRFENVSLNGIGKGLTFTTNRPQNGNGNITNYFNGSLNVSGNVNISMASPSTPWTKRVSGRTHWNLHTLNVSENSNFNITIDSRGSTGAGTLRYKSDLNGITFSKDTTFNVATNSRVNFNIKTSIIVSKFDTNYALFNGNVSVLGGGDVNFNVDASSSSFPTSGVTIKSQNFNVSQGSSLNFKTVGSTKTAFLIENDLTLNATGGNITLRQVEGTDSKVQKGIVAKKNITFAGGNITFGSQKASTEIKGNVIVNNDTNATLRGANFYYNKSTLNITGNVTNKGNLTTDGSIINIGGNLAVEAGARLQAVTNFTFNVSGKFDNKGDSNISIAKGGVHFKDIENTKNLSISTNSSSTYRTVIGGNITNNKGALNITNNGNDTEIQIGGNISQKEGNLTISSDKVNITNQITIKAGTDENSSDSRAESRANLTIKTKELKLVNNLNISGFNKAEITAKDNSDLTIGSSNSDNSNTDAKKVTFNQVKDSKISAGNHNVTLNSKVETSGSNDEAESNSDKDTGLTINAKNVTVNKDITSNKTVNITASEKLTTKADATINATSGGIEVTAKTGDIQGEVKSTSGNVNITARGDALKVSNVTGQNVTVTASSGTVTTAAGSTINATTGNASITTNTGNINGKVESSSGSVTLTATGETLTVGNISGNAVTITANDAKLTTQAGSTINGTNGVTASSKSGDIGGTISGNTVNVSASGDLTTKSGSKIEAKTGEANVTSATGTIGGTVSGDTVNIKATDKLTTQAGSSITSNSGLVGLSAQDSNIEGSINAANVTLNTTGTLTTVAGSDIKATSGTLIINAQDATLNGKASGNRTEVNATNASGS
ncbi:beta strand repeat-containing protein, partial [Haemophilus influenzae]|uniref:beta strand repeat-containing protein n=1 Tax=Haemophilus influenzae TaxID=727 RepID=UPI001F45F1FF